MRYFRWVTFKVATILDGKSAKMNNCCMHVFIFFLRLNNSYQNKVEWDQMLVSFVSETSQETLHCPLHFCSTFCVCGFVVLLFYQDTFDWEQMDSYYIKRKSVGCQFWDSVSCSALHAHYLQCAHSSHRQTNLWGSGGSSSLLMTTPHWPLQRKQMEPQGDVSISLTTWVS